MKKIVNSVEIDMTPEEISEMEAWRTPSLSDVKAQRIVESKKKRYAKEVEGVFYEGHLLLTEREDRGIMFQGISEILQGYITEIPDWKCGDGSYITITKENAADIKALILDHVQASFTKERYFKESLDACTTIEELNALNIVY